MEFCALLEGEEPDEGSDDQNDDGIGDEQPVQDHEWLDDMVRLDDGSNGERPGNQQDDTEGKTACKKASILPWQAFSC